jgi:hypothetical protein
MKYIEIYRDMKIFDFLNFRLNEELDFKMVPVEYIEKKGLVFDKETIIYSFKTKNDDYSVYFSNTYESNHILSDGSYLYDYCDGENIPTIYFSLTSRGISNNFDDFTKYNEELTVLGSVMYLINEYDIKYNRLVYTIGYVEQKKEKFYMYYLHNLDKFKLLKGKSDSYEGSVAYYLIKK